MAFSYAISEKPITAFIQLAVKSVILTFLWIPVYILRCLIVKFIPKVRKNYGRMLDYHDSALIENYTEGRPKASIVFTLILQGDLTLKDLQTLFRKNVLEATLFNKETQEDYLRYPEFKQFQVDFAGFQFWRNDLTFSIDNHIREVPYENKFKNLTQIHKDMVNKAYPKKRSPWEIVIIRNYKNSNETLLVYRSHHTLGGSISLFKVLVECLGEKNLKLPNVQYKSKSLLGNILFYALSPFYLVYVQWQGHFTALKAKTNPWFFNGKDTAIVNLSFSRRFSISDLKDIAHQNNVAMSSVILSIIAGGLGKCEPRLRQRELACEYVLPMANHPETLANHCYIGAVRLPTDINSPEIRLKKCNENFVQLRSSSVPVYAECLKYQLGTWFNPLRADFLKNDRYPIVITNVAGDEEGFAIGDFPCTEFSMSCGPLPGATGVAICTFSYKGTIQISVMGKEGVLDGQQTKRLVDLIGDEFEDLKNLS